MSGKSRSLSQTTFCFMREKTGAKRFEDRDKYDRPLILSIPDSMNLSFYNYVWHNSSHSSRNLGTFEKIEHSQFPPPSPMCVQPSQTIGEERKKKRKKNFMKYIIIIYICILIFTVCQQF